MTDDLTARGVDITLEAYPYTAGMTRLDSGVFSPGWEGRLGIAAGHIEWIATGERPTLSHTITNHHTPSHTTKHHPTPSHTTAPHHTP